jgi:hypothetical protein
MSDNITDALDSILSVLHENTPVTDHTPQIIESLRWIEKKANQRGWAPYLEFANLHGKTPMPSGLVELNFPLQGTVLGSIKLTGAARMLLEAHKKLEP